MKLHVVVCGLPGSGNRVIYHMIYRCLTATALELGRIDVYHGMGKTPHVHAEVDEVICVLPIRSPRYRSYSCVTNKIDAYSYPPDKCMRGVLEFVNLHGASLIPISYEAFVEDPERIGQHLIGRLDLKWVPFPEKADKRKPYLGRVFDGNAKWREHDSKPFPKFIEKDGNTTIPA